MKEEINPTKQNTLYLPIKQEFFDQIVAGTKKKEYREVKDTTFKKYLKADAQGLFYREGVEIDQDNLEECGVNAFNHGQFPFEAMPYRYLSLAVGYAKERDTALVEVTDITFEIQKSPDGHEMVFDFGADDKVVFTSDGPSAFWLIVYHLGKVVELKRKGE